MTKKDYTANEDIEREQNNRADEDWKAHHTTGDRYPKDAKGIGEVDVKNAHASGDGSFGRNEDSLPDEEKNEPLNNNSY